MPTLFLGFDHLPKGKTQGSYVSNFGVGFEKLPILTQATSVANFHYIDSQGWLTFNDTAASIRSLGYRIGDLVTRTGARRFGMGMRVKLPATVPATNTLVALATSVGNTGSPVVFTVAELPDKVPNKEYYLELELEDNGVTGQPITIHRKIDGVALADLSITGTSFLTSIRAGNFYIYWSCFAGTGVDRIRMKDFYFNEADFNGTSFLGPVRLVPLTFDTVEGVGFTPVNAASLKAAVTTALPESGDLFGTYAQSGISNAPLVANIGTTLSSDETVLAVRAVWGARSSDATSVPINCKLKTNGVEANLGDFTVNTAGAFGINLSQPLTAPDGTPWTVDKLNNTEIILTPTIGG